MPLDSLWIAHPKSSESDVEQKTVVPLLLALGYQAEDWQAQLTVGRAKLDFLVQTEQRVCPPYLVIECKAPSKKITHAVAQISR